MIFLSRIFTFVFLIELITGTLGKTSSRFLNLAKSRNNQARQEINDLHQSNPLFEPTHYKEALRLLASRLQAQALNAPKYFGHQNLNHHTYGPQQYQQQQQHQYQQLANANTDQLSTLSANNAQRPDQSYAYNLQMLSNILASQQLQQQMQLQMQQQQQQQLQQQQGFHLKQRPRNLQQASGNGRRGVNPDLKARLLKTHASINQQEQLPSSLMNSETKILGNRMPGPRGRFNFEKNRALESEDYDESDEDSDYTESNNRLAERLKANQGPRGLGARTLGRLNGLNDNDDKVSTSSSINTKQQIRERVRARNREKMEKSKLVMPAVKKDSMSMLDDDYDKNKLKSIEVDENTFIPKEMHEYPPKKQRNGMLIIADTKPAPKLVSDETKESNVMKTPVVNVEEYEEEEYEDEDVRVDEVKPSSTTTTTTTTTTSTTTSTRTPRTKKTSTTTTPTTTTTETPAKIKKSKETLLVARKPDTVESIATETHLAEETAETQAPVNENTNSMVDLNSQSSITDLNSEVQADLVPQQQVDHDHESIVQLSQPIEQVVASVPDPLVDQLTSLEGQTDQLDSMIMLSDTSPTVLALEDSFANRPLTSDDLEALIDQQSWMNVQNSVSDDQAMRFSDSANRFDIEQPNYMGYEIRTNDPTLYTDYMVPLSHQSLMTNRFNTL